MSGALPLVLDLADCADKSLVGMKAVNLGRMIRGGFPVPGGFVVTTEAYREAASVSEGLGNSIISAYRALGSPPVAVRSSATAEDMVGASMAGQYDTFLDITSESDLLDAVRRCWASVDSPRTRTYFAEHGIDINQVAMAVIVQRLVPADVAGVLFTANPKSGTRREMLVEASWGLGEAVVSGRVQPDVLRIDRETGRVLEANIADKQIYIPPGEHSERAVEEPRRRIACLRSADAQASGEWESAPPTTSMRLRTWNGRFIAASCFCFRPVPSPPSKKPNRAKRHCIMSGCACATSSPPAAGRGSFTIWEKHFLTPRRSPGASSGDSCPAPADSARCIARRALRRRRSCRPEDFWKGSRVAFTWIWPAPGNVSRRIPFSI